MPHQIHQLDALGDIERFDGDRRRRSCQSMVPVSGREKGSRDERVDAWCGENGRRTSAHIRLRRASQPLSATLAARGSLSTGKGWFERFRDCERNQRFSTLEEMKRRAYLDPSRAAAFVART